MPVAVLALLLVAAVMVIGQDFGSSSAPPRHRPTPPAKTPVVHFTPFTDPAGTFGGSYPSTWKRLPTGSLGASQVVLLVSGPEGVSYLVEKTPIGAVVNASNILAAKQFTARVVRKGNDVKFLHQPEVVTLGGLPGYLYLYTFTDRKTGEQGAHAHYFLFDGKTMITLVFQSLPSTSFLAAAPLFDRIAQTFHLDRR